MKFEQHSDAKLQMKENQYLLSDFRFITSCSKRDIETENRPPDSEAKIVAAFWVVNIDSQLLTQS
jgi:hypothetical protein